MDDDSLLKPCPFCGGKAEFVDTPDVASMQFVHCTQCHARTHPRFDGASGMLWNMRGEDKPTPAMAAQIAALRPLPPSITLRQRYACAALPAIIGKMGKKHFDEVSDDRDWSCEAGDAFRIADALIDHERYENDR